MLQVLVRFIVGFTGLILFLGFWVVIFKPAILDDLVSVDPALINQAEEFRNVRIDRRNPPVVWRAADYSKKQNARWWPKGESPILKGLVSDKILPPVLERTGSEPVVLGGPDGIGKYGGAFTKVENVTSGGTTQVETHYSGSSLVRWSPTGYPIVPHFAKDWEILDNYKEYIFYLRKGVKWSDGYPFTTNDIIYFWENESKDPAVNIRITDIFWHIGKLATFSAIDKYTLKIRFSDPYPDFLDRLATWHGQKLLGSPAHYLKQYHPGLGDQEFIKGEMDRYGMPNSAMLYSYVKRWNNTAHPRLWPWIYRTYTPNPPYIFVRNPYYFAVDPEGNQLPYIDRLILQERQGDMANVAAINGELSYHQNMPFSQYSLAMAQRENGNYDVYHWPRLSGTDFLIFPNHNLQPYSNDPDVIRKADLIRNKSFRQALSLAMDRDFISKVEYNGLLTAAQISPPPESIWFNERLKNSYIEYDPLRAGELLDSIGLHGRDKEGFRTFPGGERLLLYFDFLSFNMRDLAQIIASQWQAVDLRVISRYRAPRIWYTALDALELELSAGGMSGKINLFTEPKNYIASKQSHWARGYGNWYAQGSLFGNPSATGRGAIEPPKGSIYRKMMQLHSKASMTPTIEEQKAVVKEFLDISAEYLWVFCTGYAPPHSVIVKNGLKNVPRVAVFNADFQAPSSSGLETFYWENVEVDPEVASKISTALGNISPLRGHKNDEELGEKGNSLSYLIRFSVSSIMVLGLLLLAFKHPFIGRRLIIMVPTLLIISLCAFVVIELPPGDYLTSYMATLEVGGDEVDQEQIEDLRAMFELDKPVAYRYLKWVGLVWFTTFKEADRGLMQGDMGLSMESQNHVNDIVGDRLILTLSISLFALLFTWSIALPVGIYSAVRQYSAGDYIATFIGFIGMSVPSFLLALILMYLGNRFFGIGITGLFSAEFVAQPYWNGAKVWDLLKHVWVPVVVVGFSGTAGMIRIMRGNLLDELNKPYVTTARAKGVRPLKLLIKYPVRLALNPFVSGIGTLFPQLISGGAIVALILSLPTVGPLLLKALQMEDMYLAGSMLMILSLLGIIGTLVSDLLLLALDPRIRMEGGSVST